MRKILSQKDGRILKLVELLYDKEELFMRDLCAELNVSSKTLKNDIENARLILSPIDITVNGNKGVKLEIPSNYAITYVYTAVLAASLEYTLIEKIYLCETYTIDELAEELFISSSSLRRMISRVNSVLKEEEMEINSNPLQIIGNEWKIYNFFTHYLFEKYRLAKGIFTDAQINVANELSILVLKQKYIALEYRPKKQLERYILVQLIRMKNNHFVKVKSNANRDNIFSDIDTSAIKKQLKESFYKEFSNQDLIQLFSIFLDGKWSFSYNQLIKNSKINPELKQTKEKFEELLESIASKYKIEQTNREELLVQLCNYRMLDYGAYFILYDNVSVVVNHFRHDYFKGIEFIRLKLTEIFQGETLTEYKLNDYISRLIIHWDKFLIELEKEVISLKIGLVYYAEEHYLKLIQEEISHRFKDRFETIIIDYDSLADVEKVRTQCDLIVTNITRIVIPNLEVICFPVYPKEKDWSRLESFYSNFNFTK